MAELLKTVYNFLLGAIRYEYRKTEFIPLEGYPIEKMQKEISEAVKNKRQGAIDYLNGKVVGCSEWFDEY